MDQQLSFPDPAEPAAPDRGPLPPLLVTIREAAALLRLGRSTLYELIACGEIKVVRIGRSVRVPTAALDAFVARLCMAERE
jgi:excisionase family DNA binding protein